MNQISQNNANKSVTCETCGFSLMIDESGRILLCDNPNLKTFGKNVKHDCNFSCGYGVLWSDDYIEDSFDRWIKKSREGVKTAVL